MTSTFRSKRSLPRSLAALTIIGAGVFVLGSPAHAQVYPITPVTVVTAVPAPTPVTTPVGAPAAAEPSTTAPAPGQANVEAATVTTAVAIAAPAAKGEVASPAGVVSFTGAQSRLLVAVASALTAAGVVLVLAARKRHRVPAVS